MRKALLLEPNPEQELVAEFLLGQKLVLDVETDLFHLGIDLELGLHLQTEIELDLPAYPVSLVFLDFQTDQKPVGFPPDWPVDHGLSRTLLTILLVSVLSPSNI